MAETAGTVPLNRVVPGPHECCKSSIILQWQYMSDAQHEVFKHLREGQDKYTYFLLTAAGGAVALAVNQTHSEVLKWSQLPLAAAVLCWGASFFCGCRRIEYVNSVLYANLDLFSVERGIHPKAGNAPRMIEAASAGIRDAIEANSTQSSRFGRLQGRFLIAGAVLYVAWHVLEMWFRTVHR